MNIPETLAVIEALAEGIIPATGEVFAPGSPFDNPRVIRALHTAAQHLRQASAQPAQPNASPPKAYSDWSEEEDQELIRQFKAKLPIRAIADHHQRTRGAIQSRLARLDLIEPPLTPQPLESRGVPIQPWWKEQGRTQTGKAWTKEEDETLLRDFRLGVPLEEVAARLKRGVNAVEVRLAKLGIRTEGSEKPKP